MYIRALDDVQLSVALYYLCEVMNKTFSSQNNSSSSFATLWALFKVFMAPQKCGMRKRETDMKEIWSESENPPLHIVVVFSISGFEGLRSERCSLMGTST